MDSRQVLARFEAERQALALMDHPNIAKVFDAGATASGRPYFVMEWVKGMRITEYCDRVKLPTRQRLELFIQVCHAIQHAHQKGIIHRDIKPSNILVSLQDGLAMPKVIDFGIAKATTGQPLTDKTIFTALEQFVGTPAYMSPEQAELTELDIDTRSDIYALGVLLYELLTGKTPFEAKELLARGLDEVRRIIREKDPPRPSTKLSTLDAKESAEIAACRQAEPPTLLGIIRGDLDWIVMKALEKERNRRYETANGLAMDLQRYLQDEPVLARPPTNRYRFRKLIRRHRLAFAAGTAVAASLLAGIVLSTFLLLRERTARQSAVAEKLRANEQADIAKAVIQFLQDDLLRQASSASQAEANFAPNPDLTVREALNRAGQTVGERFKDQPFVEAAVRAAIGDALADLGEARHAVPHLERAWELLRTARGPDQEETLERMNNLAMAYQDAGKVRQAVTLFEELWKLMKAKFPAEDPEMLSLMNNLASAYRSAGQFDKAVPLFEESLKLKTAKLGPEAPETLITMGNLGGAYQRMGKLEQAVQLLEETLKLQQQKLRQWHPHTLATMNQLAWAYQAAGRFEQALSLLEESQKLAAAGLGPRHPTTLVTMQGLALAYKATGRLDQAVPLFEQTLELRKAKLGAEHPDTLITMGILAGAYQDAGKLDQALPLLENALKSQQATLGPEHPDTLLTMNGLAEARSAAGKFDEAVALFEQSLRLCKTNLGTNHPVTCATLAAFGSCLLQQSNYTAAEPLLREGLSLQQQRTPDDWKSFEVQSDLGFALLGQKKCSDAELLLTNAYVGLKEREKKIPATSRKTVRAAGERVVQLYEAWGKPERAKEWRGRLIP